MRAIRGSSVLGPGTWSEDQFGGYHVRVSNRNETRHVVVTGASSGIGRATAMRLARAGFRVFAGVRRDEDAESLREAGLPGVVPIIFDVTDATALARVTQEIEAEVGSVGLAGLVNNAGISGAGPLETVDLDEIRKCFEVNVMGVLAVTRALLPLLRKGTGRIVNMSSGVGRVATPLMAPYCVSKFALEVISDELRMELHRSGITVSVIEPGSITTPLIAKGDAQINRVIEQIPADAPAYYRSSMAKVREIVSRPGKDPEVVAKAVVEALTASRPRARYVVGGDAKFLLLAAAVLPARAMDALLRRMVDL
jgi:NAD(P)-dependent dehydrogenase (short-subunit alcohol dehydrogenase family)